MNYQWVWKVFDDAIQTFLYNKSFPGIHWLISQDSSQLIPVTLGSTDTRKTRTFPSDYVTRLAYRTTNVTWATCKTNQTREFVTQTLLCTGHSLRLSTEVSNWMEEVKMLLNTKKPRQKNGKHSRQDSNLRGVTPMDFEFIALTTRPRLPGQFKFVLKHKRRVHKEIFHQDFLMKSSIRHSSYISFFSSSPSTFLYFFYNRSKA